MEPTTSKSKLKKQAVEQEHLKNEKVNKKSHSSKKICRYQGWKKLNVHSLYVQRFMEKYNQSSYNSVEEPISPRDLVGPNPSSVVAVSPSIDIV